MSVKYDVVLQALREQDTGGPAGQAATIAVGTVTTGAAGEKLNVTGTAAGIKICVNASLDEV